MKTLHWHTDDNPCLLAGHPVTPESWLGGVVLLSGWPEYEGRWTDLQPTDRGGALTGLKGGWFTTNYLWSIERGKLDGIAPIYPPRGWQGLSEAEIWEAMVGGETGVVPVPYQIWLGDMALTVKLTMQFHRFGDAAEDFITINPKSESLGSVSLEHVPALILALQNALVLQRRLAGEHPAR